MFSRCCSLGGSTISLSATGARRFVVLFSAGEGTVAVGSPTLLGSASRIPKLQAAALDTRGHAGERRDAQPRLADAAGAALTSGLMRW